MIDLSRPCATIAQAAEIAGRPYMTLGGWLARGALIGEADEDKRERKGRGAVRLLTGRRVLQAVIVARLDDLGVLPGKGGWAAARFTDAGTAQRLPGCLFGRGQQTLLVVPPGEALAQVVAVGATAPLPALFAVGQSGGTVLWLDRIVPDVLAKLAALDGAS